MHVLTLEGLQFFYEKLKDFITKIQLDTTEKYSIAENYSQIFEAVQNSKSKYLQITDGSEYWDADELAKYPDVLNMEKIRKNRFYADMWLPNGLDMDQSYRYNVDKNGQIRLYDINTQKPDLTGMMPWGIFLKAEGKNYPTTAIHFVISNFKVLGLNSSTGRWDLIHNAKPLGSLYDIAHTSTEGHIIGVDPVSLGNDLYSFAINIPSNWNIDGDDMCFHFFPDSGIDADVIDNYSKLIICFRARVQEEQYSGTFTCSAGCDACGSPDVEAFFGRFNALTNKLLEYTANNCLESESDFITESIRYIDELLSDDSENKSENVESPYVLPIMSENLLGGGKAVPKTTESVPVAVDSNGKLWVPKQSGGTQTPDSGSPYDGKTVVMFGDSIVAGWGWQDGKGITEPLKEKYPLATWVNKAISGANMAEKSGASHPSILSTVKEYMGEADYILLEGGTNDVNNSIPMGSPAANYDASYDENSFCGALESALQIINDRYPLARKLFLVPHSFAKGNSYVDGIHDKAIEVCGKWNMPVLDMRQMSQIALTNANKAKYTRNPNTGSGDGVHPTETWYRAFYSPVVDQFMRSLGEYAEAGEPPENVPVTGVTLNKDSLSFTFEGQSEQLIATVQPSNATNKSLTWESDHPEIASVDQTGWVTAKAEGSATITVKTVDGNKTDQCSVNIDINEQITHEELPSLKFDTNCYFDTELMPELNTNVEIKVHVTDPDISGTWIAGARNAANKYTLSITDNWYVTRGTLSSVAKIAPFWEADWIIIQNGADFTFNGTKITCDAINDLVFDVSYYIGNCNNNGEPYAGKGFNGRFYYAKLKSGSDLVADIIPVKKTDGTLCLYDKVRQKYLYNLGSGKVSE